LEEVAKIKGVPNWISYHHTNSWIFGPFLSILINFLKSKIDLNFPNFKFEIYFESEKVPMKKIVPFFNFFKNIFYLNFYEQRKIILELVKV
jgi:hypothetical protein